MGVWLAEPVFSHGQLNVAVSRVGSRDNIKFAIKPVDEGWDNFTSNVVFREVLLDSGMDGDVNNGVPFIPTPVVVEVHDSLAEDLPIYIPFDLDYEGPHDEVLPETDADAEADEDFVFKKPRSLKKKEFGRKHTRSASLPKNLAPEENHVPRRRPLSSAAHEEWIATYPDVEEEELTEEEKEIEDLVKRRSQYFKGLFDKM